MATHMRLPFQQQHLHQPEPEQLMRRAASWEASAMAVDHHHETWPATCRESTQAAGTHNIGAGGNTWSKRIASAAASNLDSDSWEVRAFAEDASSSGQWPPRSYSCSFCQREFRTAQALGGHMNVHRRERAHANQMAQLRNATTTATKTSTTSSDQIITTAQQQVGNNAAADYHWRPAARTSSSSDLTLLQSSDLSLLKAADPVSPVKSSLPFSPQLSLSRGSMSGGLSSSCVLSTSPPSQESISSTNSGTTITTAIMQQEHGHGGNLRLMETTTTPPSAQLNFENLSAAAAAAPNYSGSWSAAGAFHPYEKSLEQSTAAINLRRFSLCFSQSMQRDQYHQDDTLDLELRLGQGPCTV